jgi:biotin operon repressor
MTHDLPSQHPPYQQSGGDHAADDRGPREPLGLTILRCLDLAAPGYVTDRYIAAVAGVGEAEVAMAVRHLRVRGVRIHSYVGGHSLPEDRRDEAVTSSPAARPVSSGFKADVHGQKPNGDIQ